MRCLSLFLFILCSSIFINCSKKYQEPTPVVPEVKEVKEDIDFFINFKIEGKDYKVTNREYLLISSSVVHGCRPNRIGYGNSSYALISLYDTTEFNEIIFSLRKNVSMNMLDVNDPYSYMKEVIGSEEFVLPLEQRKNYVSGTVPTEGHLVISTHQYFLSSECNNRNSVEPEEGTFLSIDKVYEGAINDSEFVYIVEGRFKTNLFLQGKYEEPVMAEGEFKWPIGKVTNGEINNICNAFGY